MGEGAAKPLHPGCRGPPSQDGPLHPTSPTSQVVRSQSCGLVHTHSSPVPRLERGCVRTAKREPDLELRDLAGETDRGSGVPVRPMQPTRGTFLGVLVPAKSMLQTLTCCTRFQRYCHTQPQWGLLYREPSEGGPLLLSRLPPSSRPPIPHSPQREFLTSGE